MSGETVIASTNNTKDTILGLRNNYSESVTEDFLNLPKCRIYVT